jgi:hypothetical protein
MVYFKVESRWICMRIEICRQQLHNTTPFKDRDRYNVFTVGLLLQIGVAATQVNLSCDVIL